MSDTWGDASQFLPPDSRDLRIRELEEALRGTRADFKHLDNMHDDLLEDWEEATNRVAELEDALRQIRDMDTGRAAAQSYAMKVIAKEALESGGTE